MSSPASRSLHFLGAAGTVTGSRYLIQAAGQRILVDCGLFQGYKQLRERNWADFPVAPASIDTVLLTQVPMDLTMRERMLEEFEKIKAGF